MVYNWDANTFIKFENFSIILHNCLGQVVGASNDGKCIYFEKSMGFEL